jgi:uncharacterized protein YdaU (DUF1376 family)
MTQSKKGKPPAFPFYVKDWLSSPKINLMTPAEEGAYIRLLCYAWEDQDCSLPDDDAALAQLSRLGNEWSNGSAKTLRGFFTVHPHVPGRLVNLRLLSARKEDEEWRAKCSQGGVNSAMARAAKVKGVSHFVEGCWELKANSSSSSPSPFALKNKRAASASPSTASGTERSMKLADDEFIAELKQNAAYRGIDIDREIGKLTAWLATPKGRGKHLTRQRLVNWLNGTDIPMTGRSQTVARPREVVL